MSLLRYFFERDYSLAHSCAAVATIYAVYRGHYIASAVIFVLAVAVCAAAEHKLERA